MNYIKNVPVNKAQDDSSVFIVEKEKGTTTKKEEEHFMLIRYFYRSLKGTILSLLSCTDYIF